MSESLMSVTIDSRKLKRMDMDGPALRVIMQSRSPVLFPLRRLARIYVLGVPQHGLESLVFCAEQRIPVAFFNFNGRLRCRLSFVQEVPAGIDHWLEHIAFDQHIKNAYREWLLNQGLNVLSQLGVTQGAREARVRLFSDALRGYCRRTLGEQALKDAYEWIDGLLLVHLEQVITNFGCTHTRARQMLTDDLKPICEILLIHCLAERIHQNSGFRVDAKSMMDVYHRQSEHIEYTVRRMLIQLQIRLESII